MTGDRIPDAGQREIALDTARSFIVQAPAGSGKTTLLTQRFLALLAREDAVENVLAITFTRKAASEMRNRIISALEQAANAEPADQSFNPETLALAKEVLARDAAKGWQLLSNPAALRIQTIDAFAAGLSRRLPVLSQFGAPMQVAEDAGPIYRDAASRVLERLENESPVQGPLMTLLTHLDNDYPRVERLLADMLSIREHWLGHVVGSRETDARSALEAGLITVVNTALARVNAALPEATKQELVALAAHAAENLRVDEPDSLVTACHDLAGWPAGQSVNLPIFRAMRHMLLTAKGELRKRPVSRAFRKTARDPNMAEQLADYYDRMKATLASLADMPEALDAFLELGYAPDARYTDGQWQVIDALFKILPLATAELVVVFEDNARVDFAQILIGALRAMGSDDAPTDLALILDYRVRHLLVDEFQDTSWQQFTLLERLVAGWQAGDGRTVFLVGDPMQSIYRFRNAEVGLFVDAQKNGLGPVHLEPVTLTANFRSDDSLVDWFNNTFPNILAETDDARIGAIAYAPSESIRRSGEGSGVSIHARVSSDPVDEANKVASIIYDTGRDHPGRSIAILVRSRTHLKAILPVLRRSKVAYRAVELEHLLERQIVKDLRALTMALNDPADRIAWLAVLRAPWCGLTLSDLAALIEDAPDKPLWDLLRNDERLERLSDDGRARVGRLAEVVTRSFQARGRQTLAQRVEGTWLAIGGPAALFEPAELIDARTYFNLLSEFAPADGLPDREELDRRLARLYGDPGTNDENAVQVMTLHRAKGLEFDVVIMPALERRPRSDSPRLLHWDEIPGDSGPELIFAPINAPGEPDDIHDYLKFRTRERNQHELARLAYVGVTRARHSLHLIGHVGWSSKGGKVKPPAASTLLGRTWPGIGREFENAISAHYAASEQTVALTHVAKKLAANVVEKTGLRRLPSGFSLPALPQAPNVPGLAPLRRASDIDFEWAGHTARHVGTVVHRALQEIARVGRERWQTAWQDRVPELFRQQLVMLGVSRNALDEATEKAARAVTRSLGDERGRWLLDRQPDHAVAEYAISGRVDGRVVNAVIDRSFIDQNVRWIVDYKTGEHEGGDVDGFLDNEADRYREQLRRYAQLLSEQELLPLRVGLYFPLVGGWREWDPFDAVS